MAAISAAVPLVLVLALSACAQTGRAGAPSASTPGSSTSISTPTASATTGTLTGVVRLYGGPLNPSTGKMALNGSPGPGWKVDVRSGGRLVAARRSDAAGRFRFELPPGRYSLACGGAPTAVVVAGGSVSVDCDIPVP